MNSWVSPLASGQPNNGGGIQKFISTNFGEDGKWNDNNGNSERESVCQYYTGTKYKYTYYCKQLIYDLKFIMQVYIIVYHSIIL